MSFFFFFAPDYFLYFMEDTYHLIHIFPTSKWHPVLGVITLTSLKKSLLMPLKLLIFICFYREFEGHQQAHFHSFRFSDVISIWGQRYHKLDRTLEETLKEHLGQGKKEKKKQKTTTKKTTYE